MPGPGDRKEAGSLRAGEPGEKGSVEPPRLMKQDIGCGKDDAAETVPTKAVVATRFERCIATATMAERPPTGSRRSSRPIPAKGR